MLAVGASITSNSSERNENCDVWLLTEVSERLSIEGFEQRSTQALMAPRRRWAAILSCRPLEELDDPHPATALARSGKWLLCSSILPWRSCGGDTPWVGENTAKRTVNAIDNITTRLQPEWLIWGGDWNHALSGREYAGSLAGRTKILKAVDDLGLKVPTELLPHRIPGLLTIDHIAIGQNATIVFAKQIDASLNGKRLSDHDAYVVEIAEPF